LHGQQFENISVKKAIKTIMRGGLVWFSFENVSEENSFAAKPNVINLGRL
jgi:hypothetical protein